MYYEPKILYEFIYIGKMKMRMKIYFKLFFALMAN